MIFVCGGGAPSRVVRMAAHASVIDAQDARLVRVLNIASGVQVDEHRYPTHVTVAAVTCEDTAVPRTVVATADGAMYAHYHAANTAMQELRGPSAEGAICSLRYVGASFVDDPSAARAILVGDAAGRVFKMELSATAAAVAAGRMASFEVVWPPRAEMARVSDHGPVTAIEFVCAPAPVPLGAAAILADAGQLPSEPLLLVGHSSGVVSLVLLGPTPERSSLLAEVSVAASVHSLRAQVACAYLGGNPRIAVWLAQRGSVGAASAPVSAPTPTSAALYEVRVDRQGPTLAATFERLFDALDLGLGPGPGPSCGLLDVQPAGPPRRGYRAVSLALVARGDKVVLSAIDVSAALRAWDRTSEVGDPVDLVTVLAKDGGPWPPGAAQMLPTAAGHMDAVDHIGTLDGSEMVPTGADRFSSIVQAAVQGGALPRRPTGHPLRRLCLELRAAIVGPEGSVTTVHVRSLLTDCVQALASAGTTFLADSIVAERLWSRCWAAGLIRGLSLPDRDGADGGLPPWLENAGARMVGELEHMALSSQSREAFDALGVLRQTLGGEGVLPVIRAQLMEAQLAHCFAAVASSAAAVDPATATDETSLLSAHPLEAVRSWALCTGEALVNAANEALSHVVALVDDTAAAGPVSAAEVDAIVLGLDALSLRANGLSAVAAAVCRGDAAAVARGLHTGQALRVSEEAMDAIVRVFHRCRLAAWLLTTGLFSASPCVGEDVGIRFPLPLGPCFGAIAAWGPDPAPDTAMARVRAKCAVPDAAHLLEVVGEAPATVQEAIYYHLQQQRRTVQGPSAQALARACGLMETGTPLLGVGLGEGRSCVVTACAFADSGNLCNAVTALRGATANPAAAATFAVAVAESLATSDGAGAAGSQPEVATGRQPERELASLLLLLPEGTDGPSPAARARACMRLFAICGAVDMAYSCSRETGELDDFGWLCAHLHRRRQAHLCARAICPGLPRAWSHEPHALLSPFLVPTACSHVLSPRARRSA